MQKSVFHSIQRTVLNILFIIIFSSFLLQIFMRYVIQRPFSWSLEVTLLAYLWAVFAGASFSLDQNEHIRFALVYDKVPHIVKNIFDIINALLCLAVLTYALPDTFHFVTFMKIQRTSMLDIRFDMVYSIFIIFMCSYIIKSLYQLLRIFTRKTTEE